MWVTGERQRLPHVSSQELITQKDDSSSAEMTLKKTRGFQSRVAQGSACRLQRQTYTTEGRAQPPDRNVTESTWNEVTAGAVMKMIRPPKSSNSVRSWGSVQGRASSHQHRLPSKRVCRLLGALSWESCRWEDQPLALWVCMQMALMLHSECRHSYPVLLHTKVGTQLPAAASGSSKSWHLTFCCLSPA